MRNFIFQKTQIYERITPAAVKISKLTNFCRRQCNINNAILAICKKMYIGLDFSEEVPDALTHLRGGIHRKNPRAISEIWDKDIFPIDFGKS